MAKPTLPSMVQYPRAEIEADLCAHNPRLDVSKMNDGALIGAHRYLHSLLVPGAQQSAEPDDEELVGDDFETGLTTARSHETEEWLVPSQDKARAGKTDGRPRPRTQAEALARRDQRAWKRPVAGGLMRQADGKIGPTGGRS